MHFSNFKKAGVILAGAVAAAFLLWLSCNLGVIMYGGGTGRYGITGDAAAISDAGGGAARIDFKDVTYINKLLLKAAPEDGMPASITVTAFCVTGGGIKEYAYTDLNPIYVGEEVININKNNIASLVISGDFVKGNYAVDNRLKAEPLALMFGFLFGGALTAFLIFRKEIAVRPEAAFLIIGLGMGLLFTASLPRTKVGYDEETHLQAVFALASLPSNELHFSNGALYQVIVTEYNNPSALPASFEETVGLDNALNVFCDYKTGNNTPVFSIIPNRAPAYLAMAAALKAGKFLSLGWAGLIIIIRLANLLTYLALMYFAVRLSPKGKYILMFIGLLPQNLFMAATCSYDPFITGAICLGYAFMLKGRRYAIPMLICFILGCMPKAVYAPVVLMGTGAVYLPGFLKEDGRGARKKMLLAAVLAAAVFAALIIIFILPTAIHPEDTGDIRGGGVSMLRQVNFILADPSGYAKILLSNMWRKLPDFWAGAALMTYMGHIVTGEGGVKGLVLPYQLMLLFIIILSYAGAFAGRNRENKDKSDDLVLPARAWLILMAAFSAVLIWTAMYVSFTEPGALTIAGVQGRYFIPLLFPVYLSLCGCGENAAFSGGGGPQGCLLERAVPLCYYLLVLAELIFMALTVWIFIISRHGL